MRFSPKKSLGQHFLTNPATINKIVSLAQLQPTDQVLEIGPGPGWMTAQIAATAGRVVAIEKDERLIAPLREKLPDHVTVIAGDILATDLTTILEPGPWKVIANLPYNIATEIIFRLLGVNFNTEITGNCRGDPVGRPEPRHHPEGVPPGRPYMTQCHLMVQREVAERLVATPTRPKDYGVLSIMVQVWAQTRIVMRLPPGAFAPPPKVDSAVVEFRLTDQPRYAIQNFPLFQKIVRTAFTQRRKMLRSTLGEFLPYFEKAGILPTDRPERIVIEKFVHLANDVSSASLV